MYCAVRIEALNIIQVNINLQTVNIHLNTVVQVSETMKCTLCPFLICFFRFSFSFWFGVFTADEITFQRSWFKSKAYGIYGILSRMEQVF
jgi:hypothetical protein